MVIASLGIALVGAIMLAVGGRWLLISIRNRTIAQFMPIYPENNPKEILFEETGLYSISVRVGSLHETVDQYSAAITRNGTHIDFDYPFAKYRFIQQGNFFKEFCQFQVDVKGKYAIQFSNTLPPIVVIRKAMNNMKRILGIVLTVLGFNILGWGIILACNPDIWEKIFNA